ncbi:hypothetical protein D3C74_240340 [compost metagenome]
MFYVKAKINDEITISVPLYGDQLFTTCGHCGAEKQVDETFLAEVINEGGDLAGTQMICVSCTNN